MISEQNNKIFFLHIPKTAGTSINEMLVREFDKNRVQFHIESDRVNQFKNIDCSRYDLLSGHVRLFEIENYFQIENFLRITLVRDPFHQLISHINWMKYIGQFPRNLKYFGLHESIRLLSIQMAKVNFLKLSSIEVFFKNLPDVGYALFDNCQTKYLMNSIVPDKLNLEDAHKAISTLDSFDIIGRLEQLDVFIDEVNRKMNWEKEMNIERKNVSLLKKGIDINLPGLKELLYPFYCVDQVVYDHISKNANNP